MDSIYLLKDYEGTVNVDGKGILLDLSGCSIDSINPTNIPAGGVLVIQSSEKGAKIKNAEIFTDPALADKLNIVIDFTNITKHSGFTTDANKIYMTSAAKAAYEHGENIAPPPVVVDPAEGSVASIVPYSKNATYNYVSASGDGVNYYTDFDKAMRDAFPHAVKPLEAYRAFADGTKLNTDVVSLRKDAGTLKIYGMSIVLDLAGHTIDGIDLGTIDRTDHDTLVIKSSVPGAKINNDNIFTDRSKAEKTKIIIDFSNIERHDGFACENNLSLWISDLAKKSDIYYDKTAQWDGTVSDLNFYRKSSDRYIIYDPAAYLYFLKTLAEGKNYESTTVELGCDIAFNMPNKETDELSRQIGKYMCLEGEFKGCFEGNGHTISGIYCTIVDHSSTGIIPVLNGGIIRNLTVDNVRINNYNHGYTTPHQGGILVGLVDTKNRRAVISNVTINDNCSIRAGYKTGGLVGSVISDTASFNSKEWYLKIENCVNKAAIDTFIGNSGGLIGETDSCSIVYITDSSNYGSINTSSFTEACGGLVGYSYGYVDIANSGNYANITSVLTEEQKRRSGDDGKITAGGIVGIIDNANYSSDGYYSKITNCRNDGEIRGEISAGGMVGYLGNENDNQNYYFVQNTNNGLVETVNGHAGGMCGWVDTDGAGQIFEGDKNYGFIHANGEGDAGGFCGYTKGGGSFRWGRNEADITSEGGHVGAVIGENEDGDAFFNMTYVRGQLKGPYHKKNWGNDIVCGWDGQVGKRRFMLMASVFSNYQSWIIVGCSAVVIAGVLIAVLKTRKKRKASEDTTI